jgi:hypothetical protein
MGVGATNKFLEAALLPPTSTTSQKYFGCFMPIKMKLLYYVLI